MKLFYGIDRTTDKKSEAHLGDCFRSASVSPAQQAQLEQAATEVVELEERSGLPGWLGLARTISGCIALIVFFGILRALPDVGMAQAYENAPGLFWTAVVCAGFWAVLTFVNWRIRSRVLGTEEADRTTRRMESVLGNSWAELSVPAEAKNVDVICCRYKQKGDKRKPATNGLEICENTVEEFRVFLREGKLCFANVEHRYEFDPAALKGLHKIKKHIVVAGWNKDEQIQEGFYKPYKLTADNYGRVHAKYYGELLLTHNGEEWAIRLPVYELNYIAALTGLPITE